MLGLVSSAVYGNELHELGGAHVVLRAVNRASRAGVLRLPMGKYHLLAELPERRALDVGGEAQQQRVVGVVGVVDHYQYEHPLAGSRRR